MKAVELFLANGERAELWMCTNCNRTHPAESLAERCCKEVCWDCGGDAPYGKMRCTRCLCRRALVLDASNFRYAKKVLAESWRGPVYVPALEEKYFADLEAARTALAAEGITEAELPYVWAAESVPAVTLTLEEVLESAVAYGCAEEEGWEIQGEEDLGVAIELFNEANAHLRAFDTDCSTAVLLRADYTGQEHGAADEDPAEEEEEEAEQEPEGSQPWVSGELLDGVKL